MVTTRRSTRPTNANAHPARCVIEADLEAAEAEREAKQMLKDDEQEWKTSERNAVIERVAALEESMGTPVNQPLLIFLPPLLTPTLQNRRGDAGGSEGTLATSTSDTTKTGKSTLPDYDHKIVLTYYTPSLVATIDKRARSPSTELESEDEVKDLITLESLQKGMDEMKAIVAGRAKAKPTKRARVSNG